jgi:hypothetical protein
MHFAVQVGQASIGAMARHISGAYAIHLRRRRGWTGSVFKSYVVVPVDADLFLDDLVIWLHRPPGADSCWTADSAYLTPNLLPWITTDRVLAALSPSGAGRSAYRRRKAQPISPDILANLTGRAARRTRDAPAEERPEVASIDDGARERPSIEMIAQFVARYSHIPYEEMRSASRKRVLSKAKILAAVLSTRNGASVAAVARLFGRSRSTLVERAERYRETQPQLFVHAERALRAHIENEHVRHCHAPAAVPSPCFPLACAKSRTA